MTYAKDTKVPVERSLAEIQKLLTKYGAKGFAFGSGEKQAYVAFVMGRIAVKIKIRLPPPPSDNATQASVKTFEQLRRSKYRALLLCVKAKIEGVNSGIETLEQAFLPHILLQNGTIVGETIIPKIDELNDTPPALLLGL